MAKIPRRAQPPAESSEDESEHEPTPSVKKRKSKTSESKPAKVGAANRTHTTHCLIVFKKGKKKAQSESEEDDDSEEEEVKPRSKKVQKQKKESDVSSSGPLKQDGDMKYVDLGGKKRASASEFKGQRYINIREYYVDKASGEEKPGKKGIALNAEQWKVFKQNIDTLDELFASK
ncbi:PC4-domain-containing protein [Schizophyllum commune H4-8]|nr:PC4-domain-containing protein [Schizophyllum commune H4-8]KAI5889570.1 PC4-domain-containing protein [Schizophyllum commune H4-8]